MNRCRYRPFFSGTVLLALCMAPVFAAEPLDPEIIGEASGTKPSVAEDGVVRIGWSRNGVAVTVDGMPLSPAARLGRGRRSRQWATELARGFRSALDAQAAVDPAQPQSPAP